VISGLFIEFSRALTFLGIPGTVISIIASEASLGSGLYINKCARQKSGMALIIIRAVCCGLRNEVQSHLNVIIKI